MDNDEAFLRAITDNPADNTARLVYADWLESEPWPSCADCKVGLTPVLQLRSRDVSDVAFPAGTDLLQLFWCPDEAAHGYQPAPRIWWRASAVVTSPRADDPDLSGFPRT